MVYFGFQSNSSELGNGATCRLAVAGRNRDTNTAKRHKSYLFIFFRFVIMAEKETGKKSPNFQDLEIEKKYKIVE